MLLRALGVNPDRTAALREPPPIDINYLNLSATADAARKLDSLDTRRRRRTAERADRVAYDADLHEGAGSRRRQRRGHGPNLQSSHQYTFSHQALQQSRS